MKHSQICMLLLDSSMCADVMTPFACRLLVTGYNRYDADTVAMPAPQHTQSCIINALHAFTACMHTAKAGQSWLRARVRWRCSPEHESSKHGRKLQHAS